MKYIGDDLLIQVLDEDLVKSDLVSLILNLLLRLVKSQSKFRHCVLTEEWTSGTNFNIKERIQASCT